jgi:Zn-dependent protease
MRFSYREIKDLVFAGVMISLAFAVLLAGGFSGLIHANTNLGLLFGVALFTAGTGFLLHEIMHKIVAQRYGLRAEFQAFRGMLWLALGLSFFGFIFAAPGAVFISGMLTRERNGKISLAGPLANIVIAIGFLVLLLLTSSVALKTIFGYGLYINALLAAFNMIPVMPFDGAKILAWNKTVYGIALAFALLLFAAGFAL